MSSIIKVGKVQSSTGSDAITVADSGAITATGALTASGGIANAGTITAGTLGSSVVFPAGHVVQTVSQKFNTTTEQTSYAAVATHIENEINITAGNKVFFNYTIPTRLLASNYNYGQFFLYVYHKTTSGGTYASLDSKIQASVYYDQSGNLDNDFYRYANVPITGVHTPSSGTQQFYRIYVELVQGNDVNVGIATSLDVYATLMEIQA
tara:strand:- start:334 stop:957 length:624 start_codon:yes stop_codon:yes gene_type:complete